MIKPDSCFRQQAHSDKSGAELTLYQTRCSGFCNSSRSVRMPGGNFSAGVRLGATKNIRSRDAAGSSISDKKRLHWNGYSIKAIDIKIFGVI